MRCAWTFGQDMCSPALFVWCENYVDIEGPWYAQVETYTLGSIVCVVPCPLGRRQDGIHTYYTVYGVANHPPWRKDRLHRAAPALELALI